MLPNPSSCASHFKATSCITPTPPPSLISTLSCFPSHLSLAFSSLSYPFPLPRLCTSHHTRPRKILNFKKLRVNCATHEPLKVMISGAPASGKGTQCQMIVQQFGLVHISTGDLLRAEVAAGTEIGNQAKEYMNTGRLVPDDIVTAMVRAPLSLEDAKDKGWLLDGYPRTSAQAQSLEELGIRPDVCIVLEDARTGETIGRGTERDGLYYVDETTEKGHTLLAQGSMDRQLWIWHRRLGHPSLGYLKRLIPSLSSYNKPLHCETCVLSKSHKQSYFPSHSRSNKPFVLIHSDVWGPAPETNNHGFSYFISFVDDCTRMCWVYFLKSKSDVFDTFVMFYNMLVTQFHAQLQILRSDNGGEFVNHKMKHFMSTHGLIHQTSCPYTPQQNGVAERKNRTLLEITRSLMFEAHVPAFYWPEAIATATYLTNRLPTKILQYKTPLDALSTHFPNTFLHSLPPRVFGCVVYVHLPHHARNKLEPRALKCLFLGYGVNQKGYRCYDPEHDKLYTTMDCDFFEGSYYYSPHHPQGETLSDDDALSWLTYPPISVSPDPNEQVCNPVVVTETDVVASPSATTDLSEASEDTPNPPEVLPDIDTDELHVDTSSVATNEPCRYDLPPRRTRGIPPKRYDPEYEAQRSRYPPTQDIPNLSEAAVAFNTSLYTNPIPRNSKEALEDPRWRQAMEDEITALKKNDTWEKCLIPEGKRTVGCKWVFTIKYHSDGSIERYKARLVAKGYTQTYGIDYSETFSPVAKIDTIRVLFSIAANRDWPLYQFDVKNAFLHGEIEEEVFMDAPPGFMDEFGPKEGCRLKKALYGLKQSPRAWFGRFTAAMRKFGYTQSHSDHTLFIKRRGHLITCLIIYVDDMVITGNDKDEIENLKRRLFQEFEMKDLGNLKYFLGIEVLRSRHGIFVCQKKYILDLLAETGMLDCKPAETPIVVNHGLQTLEDGEPTDKEQYQRLVGKLIYLAHTRPDISYAVGVVSRFMHRPQVAHMEAVTRILRYLKGTSGRGVFYRNNGNLDLVVYTDSDWAGDKDSRKSTSGYFTLIGGNLVTWRSKKQNVVALSSAEAEYRGIAKGVTEALWLRKLLSELSFPQKEASKLFCDNEAAISISNNPVQHDRTKHVEVDRHFIKEKLENQIISLPSIQSKDQLADILTKAVTAEAFEGALCKLGIGEP